MIETKLTRETCMKQHCDLRVLNRASELKRFKREITTAFKRGAQAPFLFSRIYPKEVRFALMLHSLWRLL
jgi:hypothetical protein